MKMRSLMRYTAMAAVAFMAVEAVAATAIPLRRLAPDAIEQAELKSAVVYNGYLTDKSGKIAGSIELKVAKLGRKSSAAKAVATILHGTSKDKVAASVAKDGTVLSLRSPALLQLAITRTGMTGTYGEYKVDGALNIFKDRSYRALAAALMKRYGGGYTVVWENGESYAAGMFTVNKNGKTKFKAFKGETTVSSGTKSRAFSASGQLVVNDRLACVTIVSTKAAAPLAFNVWMEGNGYVGVDGLAYGMAGTLGNLYSRLDYCLVHNTLLDASFATPEGGNGDDSLFPVIKVAENGKWTVEPKANPVKLKVSYNPKTGRFKGSFKSFVSGKHVGLIGFVVNGSGFGFTYGTSAEDTAVVIQ